MIDRLAIEELLRKHVASMDDAATVELHLFNGEVLFLRSAVEFFDSYFIATTFASEPLDPSNLDERIPKNSDGARVFDRVILPYQTISYIRLTASKPNLKSSLGFTT